MIWSLVFPLMTPFVTAVLSYLYRGSKTGHRIAVGGSAVAVVAAMFLMFRVLDTDVVVGQMGNWIAPYGITLVADRLSAIMVLLTALSGLAVTVFATAEIDQGLRSWASTPSCRSFWAV